MTATLKTSGGDLQQFLAEAAAGLSKQIARGALRAGAVVIAERAKEECRSVEVRKTIGVSTRAEASGVVSATVQTKGDGAYKAPWLENGTDPHFISVDSPQSGGMTVRKVNKLDRKAAKDGREGPGHSLLIGGKFVGETVYHPGARPYPFMRPALDSSEGAAIEAIGGYIKARATKEGLISPEPVVDESE